MKRYIAIITITIDGQPDEDAARNIAEYIADDLATRDFGGEEEDVEVRGSVTDWFWDEVIERWPRATSSR